MAILKQAAQEAKAGALDAILWLAAAEAEPFAEVSELDSRAFVKLGRRLMTETPIKKIYISCDPFEEASYERQSIELE